MNYESPFLQSLAAEKRAQPSIVAAMLREGRSVEDALGAIADANREIHRRVLERAIVTTRVNGISRPPVPVTLLVMGSGGRGENLLNPDQDNGFILGDYADEDHGRIDPYFIALADRFNADLARIGFPLCQGNIMARNPVWRKTERQWRNQVDHWMRRRDPVAVRFGDAFLDFRPVAGPCDAAARLRAHVNGALKNDSAMLTELCRDAPHRGVAIGWFGHLATEHDGKYRGMINLKEQGTLPLVSSTRLWALRHSVHPTGTAARLRALGELGVIEPAEVRTLIDAFFQLTGVILRFQVHGAMAGSQIGYWIDPTELAGHERDRVVAALRTISDFQAETRAVFAGELY